MLLLQDREQGMRNHCLLGRLLLLQEKWSVNTLTTGQTFSVMNYFKAKLSNQMRNNVKKTNWKTSRYEIWMYRSVTSCVVFNYASLQNNTYCKHKHTEGCQHVSVREHVESGWMHISKTPLTTMGMQRLLVVNSVTVSCI